jgi:diguanylate cyclase (GGDEF)-like protein
MRAWKLGPDRFSEEHWRFALTLASQTALALSAAEANRQQTARIRQLGTLYETSLKLSESTTLEEVLQVIVRGAAQITGAEGGIIWRRQPDGGFVPAAVLNVPADDAAKHPPNQPDSLSNEMLRTGQPVVIADIQTDPRWPAGFVVAHVHSLVGVPLRSEGVMYGTLWVHHSRIGFFRPEHVRHLEVLAAQAAATFARAGAFEEAHRLAITDELTGFYNARFFTSRVQEEVQRAARYGHALSLVMIDSDSLKHVNDRFGHEEGNRYLVELAQIIRESVRNTDILARFGGDEFLVLQPETELAAAVATADRIRAAAARPFAPQGRSPIDVHVSGGVSAYPATANDHEELFRQADHALYVAKRRGKNSVAAAPITGEKSE